LKNVEFVKFMECFEGERIFCFLFSEYYSELILELIEFFDECEICTS